MRTVASCCSQALEQALSHTNRATVFLDSGAAEVLHWQGGLLRMLEAGAHAVKEFSSFESAPASEKKGVFIVSSLLDGVTSSVMEDIVRASHFQYVVVLAGTGSTVNAFSRTGTLEDDPQLYAKFADRLLEWMGNMNYTAEVFHLPLLTVSLGNSLFLMPAVSGLCPLTNSDLPQVERQYNSRQGKTERKVDFDNLGSLEPSLLPKDLQLLYMRFVSCLDSLLESLGVKEDIYSLGYTSGMLAANLEAYPPARSRRKSAQSRASILLIDRILDLATTTSHNTESLLDKVNDVLPRLPGHTTDVKVNMSSLSSIHKEAGSDVISPGCLATVSPAGTSQMHLNNLIYLKTKEALMDVNRQLVEAASRSNLPLSLSGRPTRVTSDQLTATLSLFRGKYKEIASNLDSIQVAMATQQTLSSPRMQHCDEFISVEKGLLLSVADPGGPGALSQILQLVQKKDKAGSSVYSLDDLLCLLVHVYSLAGHDLHIDNEEERELQAALVERIRFENDCLPPLMKDIVGEGASDWTVVTAIIDDVWDKLHAISAARAHLQQFRSVVEAGSAMSPPTHNSLVKQVAAAILDPQKPELPDIEFKSSGLRDMLKSGFGLFRSVAKPRPSDHPLLIVFVVGGVSCSEAKQIKDLVSSYKPSTQVVVGSTRLVTPTDIVRAVLCQNNVNPVDAT